MEYKMLAWGLVLLYFRLALVLSVAWQCDFGAFETTVVYKELPMMAFSSPPPPSTTSFAMAMPMVGGRGGGEAPPPRVRSKFPET